MLLFLFLHHSLISFSITRWLSLWRLTLLRLSRGLYYRINFANTMRLYCKKKKSIFFVYHLFQGALQYSMYSIQYPLSLNSDKMEVHQMNAPSSSTDRHAIDIVYSKKYKQITIWKIGMADHTVDSEHVWRLWSGRMLNNVWVPYGDLKGWQTTQTHKTHEAKLKPTYSQKGERKTKQGQHALSGDKQWG